jgi:hypothetical protein
MKRGRAEVGFPPFCSFSKRQAGSTSQSTSQPGEGGGAAAKGPAPVNMEPIGGTHGALPSNSNLTTPRFMCAAERKVLTRIGLSVYAPLFGN